MAAQSNQKRKAQCVSEHENSKKKRATGISITYFQFETLRFATKHIPQGTPKRWDLISTLVNDCSSACNDSPHMLLKENDASCIRLFDRSASDCKEVVRMLCLKYKGMFEFSESTISKMLLTYVEKSALKYIILLPHAKECCGEPIIIRNRPTFPLVYTSKGTFVAAMFSGECRRGCSNKFCYSYYLHDSKTHYYSLTGNFFFHITSKTIFDTSLLEDITNNVSISATSFQSISDCERLIHLSEFGRSFSDTEHPWKLTEKRIEDAWFIYSLVLFYSERGGLEDVDFNTAPSASQRIDVDELCGKAWEVLLESTNPWIHHKCKTKGCLPCQPICAYSA